MNNLIVDVEKIRSRAFGACNKYVLSQAVTLNMLLLVAFLLSLSRTHTDTMAQSP